MCLDLKLPIRSEDDIISQFERVISENEGIKVALIDHITCPSAILMPLKSLIDLCHRNGILVIVDGAHAPGHIPLNLEELSADFYTGEKLLFVITIEFHSLDSKLNQIE